MMKWATITDVCIANLIKYCTHAKGLSVPIATQNYRLMYECSV
jgi:hypothetical protein